MRNDRFSDLDWDDDRREPTPAELLLQQATWLEAAKASVALRLP